MQTGGTTRPRDYDLRQTCLRVLFFGHCRLATGRKPVDDMSPICGGETQNEALATYRATSVGHRDDWRYPRRIPAIRRHDDVFHV